MAATIIELPHNNVLRTPIAHVIRTGETHYRKLENLHARGRLPDGRVIVDASKARFQKGFIRSLRDRGSDIALDTKVAELSVVGKFRGSSKGAPWALGDDRPLIPADFEWGSNTDLYGKIARHAVELGVTAVLAPSHLLKDGCNDPWLPIDRSAVSLLRAALDREGGSAIGIDYPIIVPHMRFLDAGDRAQIVAALHGLPVDNFVLRLSGFGADAGPLTTQRTLIALADARRLECPILLDHLGGLVGLSALAFGTASGIAHGIGEHDRFDARDWHKSPVERDKEARFGRTTYVPLPGFDRSFRKSDLEAIASAPGGRRLVSCAAPKCCARGLTSMLDDPLAHIAHQKQTSITQLLDVPDTRRIGHFIDVEMRNAERQAGELARLKTPNEKINNALVEGRRRINSMARMYESLAEREWAPALPMRRRNVTGGAIGRTNP